MSSSFPTGRIQSNLGTSQNFSLCLQESGWKTVLIWYHQALGQHCIRHVSVEEITAWAQETLTATVSERSLLLLP